jgi:hypothetical protein
MPLPLIPLLAAFAAPLADTVADALLGSDSRMAEPLAKAVIGVAEQVSGVKLTSDGGNAAEIAAVIAADPTKALDFQRLVNEAVANEMAADNERLRTVNETMRAEIASDDPYVRRMRPTWGYVMAATWAATMGAVAYTIVAAPADAGKILSGLADTTALWGIGLAVLGAYVTGRTKEKTGAGMLDGILGRRG